MTDTRFDRPQVTALILCGGRARRLGGVDKGLYPLAGRVLVEYVIERTAPQVDAILISANRNIERYERYGYPVVADQTGSFDGPLAGVLAGLRTCRTEWLVTVPCDAPNLPHDLVRRLIESAGTARAVCAEDGKRLQPTFCAFRRDLASPLAAYLETGERKIDRFLESVGFSKAGFAGREDDFLNLNSAEDVASFEQAIRS